MLPSVSGRAEPRDHAVPVDPRDITDALASVDSAELGARLKKARTACGMTQTDAAYGLISSAYLSRIESGARRPDHSVLKGLAARLGTTDHELLLGLTPKEWRSRSVEIEWADLEVRTGKPEDGLSRTTGLLAELPEHTAMHRRALTVHGAALEGLGRYEEAAEYLEELVERCEDTTPLLEAMISLTRCYRLVGELGRAIKTGERAAEHISGLGLEGTHEALKLTLSLAAAHAESGDLGYAARLIQRTLKRAEKLASPGDRANCYWNASVIESRRGNNAAAVELGQRAMTILDESGAAVNAARLRTQLGILHLRLDTPDVPVGLDLLRRAETELAESGASPSDMANNRLAQAKAHFLQGRHTKARKGAAGCLSSAQGNAPMVTAEAHVLLGRIAFNDDDAATARAHYREAILSLSALGSDRGAAQLWYELGALWQSVNCPEDALDAFMRAGASLGLQRNATTPDRAGGPRTPSTVG